MAEENKMHGGTCGGCNCGDHGPMEHIGKKNRYKLLKLLVIFLFMYMAFSFGVHLGEIKGALGITPFGQKYNKQMMYQSNWMVPGMN